jgi:hypothetical protein
MVWASRISDDAPASARPAARPGTGHGPQRVVTAARRWFARATSLLRRGSGCSSASARSQDTVADVDLTGREASDGGCRYNPSRSTSSCAADSPDCTPAPLRSTAREAPKSGGSPPAVSRSATLHRRDRAGSLRLRLRPMAAGIWTPASAARAAIHSPRHRCALCREPLRMGIRGGMDVSRSRGDVKAGVPGPPRLDDGGHARCFTARGGSPARPRQSDARRLCVPPRNSSPPLRQGHRRASGERGVPLRPPPPASASQQEWAEWTWHPWRLSNVLLLASFAYRGGQLAPFSIGCSAVGEWAVTVPP